MTTILVTGGAGYVGSHTVHELVDGGHNVVVLDDLSTGSRVSLPAKVEFIEGSIADLGLVASILRQWSVEAVLHFAGSIVVPESMVNPLDYYDNNTIKSHSLIKTVIRNGIRKFIFSSTAAVY